jgi:hypothetical protein
MKTLKALLAAIIATAACVVFSTQANAGELVVHTGSVHGAAGFNNTNPGIGYVSDDGYAFGVYHNSYKNTTVCAAKLWETSGRVGVGALLGVGTGYKIQTGLNVSPLAALSVFAKLDTSRGVRVLHTPGFGGNASVTHLTFTVAY